MYLIITKMEDVFVHVHRTLTAAATVPLPPALDTGERRLHHHHHLQHRLTEFDSPAVAPALVTLSSCSRLPARRSRTTPRRFPIFIGDLDNPIYTGLSTDIASVLLFTHGCNPEARFI
jgi:hypothetical protein